MEMGGAIFQICYQEPPTIWGQRVFSKRWVTLVIFVNEN